MASLQHIFKRQSTIVFPIHSLEFPKFINESNRDSVPSLRTISKLTRLVNKCLRPSFNMICDNFHGRKRAIRKHCIKLSFGGNRGSLLAADTSYHRERDGEQNRYSFRRQPILRRHGVLANCTVGPPAGLIKSNHRQFCPRETLADLRLLSFCSSFRTVRSRKGLA